MNILCYLEAGWRENLPDCAGLCLPLRGPHRKTLQLRGFDLKVRFDGSIARLLDAGGWLKLRAGGWLGLSWAHLDSGGRFACCFRNIAGWLRMLCLLSCVSPSIEYVRSERLLAGFDALSGVSHARAPEESAD